jgi:hypothetical protein
VLNGSDVSISAGSFSFNERFDDLLGVAKWKFECVWSERDELMEF